MGTTNVPTVIDPAAKIDGGLVPQISPLIKPLLTLFPDPNLPNNQYTFSFTQPTSESYFQTRIDHNVSASDSLFGRYTIDDALVVTPRIYPQFRDNAESRSQYVTLSENHIFSATLLNTARSSFSRTNIVTDSLSGIIGPQFSLVPGKEVGSISIAGISPFGPAGADPGIKKQNIFTWSDDLFYTRGRHSLKFGTLVNRYQQYMLNSSGSKGSISFANLTNFLLARPTTYTATTVGSIQDRTYHYSTFGFYVQDDWRLASNFTLNAGLRYEFNTQVQEVRGHGAALRDIQNDAQPTLGPPMINSSLRNFSPRLGFAWDLSGNGMTAVRGGFGLLYDIGNMGSTFIAGALASPPFSSQSSVNSPPSFTIPLVFPSTTIGRTLRTLDYWMQQPHMLQYNLTIERQLPWNMGMTAAYAGSRGFNLVTNMDGNPTVPQVLSNGQLFWTGNETRINPNWDSIQMQTASVNSWYNSLQLSLNRRLSKGLQFQSAYTFSKLLDEGQGQLAGESSNTSASVLTWAGNRKLDKGPANFDITHQWRFNAIYQLPEPAIKGIGELLKGWRMSGILSLNTGSPFTPLLGSNRSRSKTNGGGGGIDRPDLIPGRKFNDIVSGTSAGCLGVPVGTELGGPDMYFDPCAFTIPAAGFLGNAGRNILRGPGFANLDLSITKDIALGILGESGKVEFRAEAFNVLNRANFASPSNTVFSAVQSIEAPLTTAGRINSTVGTSRQIQLALKILF